MLSISVRYMTGYAAAGRADDREAVEWPPHPARLFMAMAAAHFATGAGEAEREALLWLERLDAPEIVAGPCRRRSLAVQFAPVNDDVGSESVAPLQSAPGLSRHRQERAFPRAWLSDEFVHFLWAEAEPGQRLEAIASLCAKTTRLGHSSCLVQVTASTSAPAAAATCRPDERHATQQLRVPVEGTLELLAQTYGFSGREVRHPTIASFCGYAETAPARERPAGTVWEPELLVAALARREGPVRYLDSAATLLLTARMRAALLEHLGTGVPEALSGHRGNGPAQEPHLALLALPFVSHEHADGRILGVALALPRGLTGGERLRLVSAFDRLRGHGLKLGPLGVWDLKTSEIPWRETLRSDTWTAAPRGAAQWATVSPYVFDSHPKSRARAEYVAEAAQAIGESWGRVRCGDSADVTARTTPVSAHTGAPAARDFPRLRRKDDSELRHTHVVLRFSRPVVGPLLLGAGRFRGYGLFRPLSLREP